MPIIAITLITYAKDHIDAPPPVHTDASPRSAKYGHILGATNYTKFEVEGPPNFDFALDCKMSTQNVYAKCLHKMSTQKAYILRRPTLLTENVCFRLLHTAIDYAILAT